MKNTTVQLRRCVSRSRDTPGAQFIAVLCWRLWLLGWFSPGFWFVYVCFRWIWPASCRTLGLDGSPEASESRFYGAAPRRSHRHASGSIRARGSSESCVWASRARTRAVRGLRILLYSTRGSREPFKSGACRAPVSSIRSLQCIRTRSNTI